jgi:glycosyltransferase involved in cell wall biosynthesis
MTGLHSFPRIRILNVIGSRHVFGAERVVFELTKALQHTGHEVSVLCSPELGKFYSQAGAEVIPLIYRGVGHFMGVLALSALSRRFDILHMHGISASIICALAPNLRNKCVTTVHGSEAEVLTSTERNWRDRFTRFCVSRSASRSRRIIAVTSNLANTYSQYGSKVSIVFNGANVDMIRSMAAENRKSAEWLNDLKARGAKSLFLPGRLSVHSKGQDIAVEALGILRKEGVNCHLLLSGVGEDLYRLRTLARRFEVDEKVIFLGYLPRGVQLALMASSDIVVTHIVNRRFGGVSQVHLEAAILARPIITMAHPDLAAFNDCAYFVDLPAPQEVASTIGHILEHPREAERRALRAAAIAKKQFSWDTVIDKYLETYLAV